MARARSDSTFLFAGKQLGFFKEQGIDLEIQTTPGTVAAAGLIASGALDIALGGLEALPGYVLQGVAMKAVYLYSYRPIFMLGFLSGSKVQKVADLKGARIGVISLGSGSIPVLEYILREAGLTLKDTTPVPLGLGPATLAAVKNGEVDALMYHDTAMANFATNGIVLTIYADPKLEKGYAGQGIYVLEKTLQERRPAVEKFLRGLTKSLVYASKDPAGATKAFGQLYPEIAKNPALEEKLWRERRKISQPPPEAHGEWGYMDKLAWENLLDVLSVGGILKAKPPAEKLYTTELLKSANEVDTSNLP
ncbi:MAG: ABC transporter substrate-binding protein [Alphaproteobacteria bacterium]